MAKDKKSFVLYSDYIELFKELSNEDAGKLIKHIFSYVNDENPVTKDPIVKLSFIPIKQQLKRDLKKYESIKEKRSKAGKKSAELRAITAQQSSTNPTSVKSVQQSSTNPTVNDNVIVTVNGNDTVNDNVIESVINKKTHPALIGFRNNVFKEAKEQGITNEVAEKFFKHWTAIDEHTKKFLYQATEPFGIQNRLKNYNEYENKNNSTFKKATSKDFEL